MAGGTMMYFKALIEGLAPQLPSGSESLRAELQTRLIENGLKDLVDELVQVDPDRFRPTGAPFSGSLSTFEAIHVQGPKAVKA